MNPALLRLLSLLCALCSAIPASADFHAYLPSRETNQLWIVAAEESGDELSLTVAKQVDLGFPAATIVAHPVLPRLYVATNTGDDGNVPGAVITLDSDGAYQSHEPITLEHGYSYLSLDRENRHLLGAYYRGGHVDVYPVDKHGTPGTRVAFLDEGRPNAHAVLVSPDNKFVYIPYVKDTNALLQYAFDSSTGALTPLSPANAKPPEGTGPRHIAYHPTLPCVYFSNEQGLGVSVYEKHLTSGQLVLRQVVDVLPANDRPEKGASASDIAVTPDGKFLFTGQRSADDAILPNAINRYRILDDGKVQHLGRTPADAIPWGLALSPDARYLLVTAFKGATLTAYRITSDGALDKAATLPIDPKISDLVTR